MPIISKEPQLHSRASLTGYNPAVLARSCVAVVGLGALGQNVALDLALSGVRSLRLVDGDAFENHNRTRSPLHPRRGEYVSGDVLPKASAVARGLALIHVDDDAEVLAADTWIEELGLGAFEGVDVIAACVDSLVAREYLARVALLLDIPIVDGGFSGPNLGMTVYPRSESPAETPCWSCAGVALPGAFSCAAYATDATSRGVVPAIQNGAAVLGGLCAEAVVMLLHDREPEPRRVALDLRSGETRAFRPSPDPVCASLHRRLVEVPVIELGPEATVEALLDLVGEEGTRLVLPGQFVERANCPACGATCEVGAPTHRWRRDARCEACGGAWPAADRQLPSPHVIDGGLGREQAQSSLTLAALGFMPADVVELAGSRYEAVRLSGDPLGLFRRA